MIEKGLFDFEKMSIICAPSVVGFDMPNLKLSLISFTKGALFRTPKKPSKNRYKKLPSEKIISYSDLVVGDFVVH
jgi:hypothetical protein